MDIKKQTYEEIQDDIKKHLLSAYETIIDQIFILRGCEKENSELFKNLEEDINLQAKYLISYLYDNRELRESIVQELLNCNQAGTDIIKKRIINSGLI